MTSDHPTEKSIFLDALDIESLRERAAFIEEACQGSPQLFASVSALLREHERAFNPIDKPIAQGMRLPPGNMDETESPSSQAGQTQQAIGTMIGPYKLMEQIGEGGFGLVYVADQLEPMRRRVALKVIKPGMESRRCSPASRPSGRRLP